MSKKLKVHKQKEAIETYETKLKGTESQLSKLRAKLNRINHRASYWTMRVGEFNHQAKEAKLRQEIESLEKKISSLDSDNAEMSETLESILSSEEILQLSFTVYLRILHTNLLVDCQAMA